MTTKELIKLLKKRDSTGDSHVRINDEPIIDAELKEGYWDGPYNYIKRRKNKKPIWVQSTRKTKVDIHTIDLFSFADYFNGNWNEMKKHIKIEYDYLDNGKEEKEFLKTAKEECDEYNRLIKEFYEQALKEMTENAKKGWKWFQNKDIDKNQKPNYHIHYTWKIYNEKGEEEGSNIYNTECVMKSRKWKKIDNKKKKGYYEWVFKI